MVRRHFGEACSHSTANFSENEFLMITNILWRTGLTSKQPAKSDWHGCIRTYFFTSTKKLLHVLMSSLKVNVVLKKATKYIKWGHLFSKITH